jgi:16S rRNA (cytosine1402-N4)-methyltransferase
VTTMSNHSSYHLPVMLDECIDALDIQAGGIYLDVTFGGGGHSKAILSKLSANGKLFAFDQDEDALNNTIEDSRFTLIQANFRLMQKFMRLHGVKSVNGILADLGVSSHQLDDMSRGFSYRSDVVLDMRMHQSQELTAAKVISKYTAEQLQLIFSNYGEIRNSKTLAQAIVQARSVKSIIGTKTFLSVVEPYIMGERMRYLSQLFQAIRIEVNDELGALKEFLEQCGSLLEPDGRCVIMSYHSLEDRLVKNYFKSGNTSGIHQKNEFGHITRPFTLINKKPISPKADELKRNPRAGSALLRIAQKN